MAASSYSDFKIIPTATTKQMKPKASFGYFCGRRDVSILPTAIPATLPAANGSATSKLKCPADMLAATPVNETREIIAKDVATTDCAAKSV